MTNSPWNALVLTLTYRCCLYMELGSKYQMESTNPECIVIVLADYPDISSPIYIY